MVPFGLAPLPGIEGCKFQVDGLGSGKAYWPGTQGKEVIMGSLHPLNPIG